MALVKINIPGIGEVTAENAASEDTLIRLVAAIEKQTASLAKKSGGGAAGSGGAGGGGSGSATNTDGATAGTANTGGGGGGGANTDTGVYAGRNGGSGVVIIRYADSFPAATSTTGSPTITVAGGYRVYRWTSSGSITF
jgi:hypothetical protein